MSPYLFIYVLCIMQIGQCYYTQFDLEFCYRNSSLMYIKDQERIVTNVHVLGKHMNVKYKLETYLVFLHTLKQFSQLLILPLGLVQRFFLQFPTSTSTLVHNYLLSLKTIYAYIHPDNTKNSSVTKLESQQLWESSPPHP